MVIEEARKVNIRQQINADKFAWLPKTGNLQYGRTRKPAVRKEQIFTKNGAVLGGDNRGDRHAREHLKLLQQWLMQRKGHQSCARWQYVQTELFGNFITKRRRAQPRHRETTRGNNQLFRAHGHPVQFENEIITLSLDAQDFAT